MPPDAKAFQAQMLAAICGHDRLDLTKVHVLWAYYFVGRFWVSYFPELLGRFLIGSWAGTTGLFQDPERNLPRFRKIARWGLPIVLGFSALRPVLRLLDRRHLINVSAGTLQLIGKLVEPGSLILAGGYAAVVVLLMQRRAGQRVLKIFAPAGQMALTTYIGMSVLSTFVFYGFGLRLAPNVRPATVLPITLCLFTVEIRFAHSWLSRFRFGPLEWLWRSLTYGRIQPMRRGL